MNFTISRRRREAGGVERSANAAQRRAAQVSSPFRVMG
jgi:hypothetical protein